MSTNPPTSDAEEADRRALDLAEAVRRHLSGTQADRHLFGRTDLLMRAATAAEPAAAKAGLDGIRLANLIYEVRRFDEQFRLGSFVEAKDRLLRAAVLVAQASRTAITHPVDPAPLALSGPGLYRTRGGLTANVVFASPDRNWHGEIRSQGTHFSWGPDGRSILSPFHDLVAKL